MGWQWEARILERFCEYVIDGVPGWGVSEWHYRHYGDRPTKYAELDPPRDSKGSKILKTLEKRHQINTKASSML